MDKSNSNNPLEYLEDYITIENGLIKCYGGNQKWWGVDSQGEHYGCGVIAATNYLFYLSQSIYSRFSLNENIINLSQVDYQILADTMWKYIKPSISLLGKQGNPRDLVKSKMGHGVLVSSLVKGLKAYGKDSGYEFEFDVLKSSSKTSLNKVLYFIEKSLNAGLPIMALSVKNQSKKYEFHWVTITGMIKDDKKQSIKIIVSTWGEKAIIKDWKVYWGGSGLLYRQYLVTMNVTAKD